MNPGAKAYRGARHPADAPPLIRGLAKNEGFSQEALIKIPLDSDLDAKVEHDDREGIGHSSCVSA